MAPAAKRLSTNSAFFSILEPTQNQYPPDEMALHIRRAIVPPVVSIPILLDVSMESLSISLAPFELSGTDSLEKNGKAVKWTSCFAFGPFVIQFLTRFDH